MPFTYHLHHDMFIFLPKSSPYHAMSTTSLSETRFHITNISESGVGWGLVLHEMLQLTTNQLTTNSIHSLMFLLVLHAIFCLDEKKLQLKTVLSNMTSNVFYYIPLHYFISYRFSIVSFLVCAHEHFSTNNQTMMQQVGFLKKPSLAVYHF